MITWDRSLFALTGLLFLCSSANTDATISRAEFLARVRDITVEYPKRADGSTRPILDNNWYIRPIDPSQVSVTDIKEILRTGDVVSEHDWTHAAVHTTSLPPANTGLLLLDSGEAIRWAWLVDSRFCLRFPDGRWLYLLDASLAPRPYISQPWEPVTEQSSFLDVWSGEILEEPKILEPMLCQVGVVSQQQADECLLRLNQELLSGTPYSQ